MARSAEQDQLKEPAEKLEELGYAVELEPRIRLGNSARFAVPDLIGWVQTDEGLRQGVVVEVLRPKSSRAKRDGAAQQVLKLRSLMPTALAFLYDGEWHRVEPGVDAVFPEDPPLAKSLVHTGTILHQLPRTPPIDELGKRAARATAEAQAGGFGHAELVAAIRKVESGRAGTLYSSMLGWLPSGRRAIAKEWLAIAARDAKKKGVVVPQSLTRPMARLLLAGRREDTREVFDPSCGRGSLLFGVMEELGDTESKPLLAGMSMDESDAGFTETLLAFAGCSVSAKAGNIFDGPSERLWQNVVALPPLGYRRGPGVPLDGLGVLNVARCLGDGGRAVIATVSGVLSARYCKDVREKLSSEFRIVAVIALPPGGVLDPYVPISILVLERSTPGPTLVAELDEDWQDQVSSDGEFFREYLNATGSSYE